MNLNQIFLNPSMILPAAFALALESRLRLQEGGRLLSRVWVGS